MAKVSILITFEVDEKESPNFADELETYMENGLLLDDISACGYGMVNADGVSVWGYRIDQEAE